MKFIDKVKFKATFWAVTLPMVPYFFTILAIALLNPFWFRDDLLRFTQRQVQKFNDWRSRLLKPQLDKYKMFEILKQNSSNVAGKTQSPKAAGSKSP